MDQLNNMESQMAKPKKERQCTECGRTFAEYRPQQQFCSTKCRNRYHAKKRREELERLKAAYERSLMR